MYISDLVNFIKDFIGGTGEECEVKAVLSNNNVINVSPQQYVIDGDYHMFARTNNGDPRYDRSLNVFCLKSNLEYEGSDKCWRSTGDIFDDCKSDFFDCPIYIVTGNYDDFHNCLDTGTYFCHEVFSFKYEDDVLYLICDESLIDVEEEDDDDSIVTSDIKELKVRVDGG